MVDTKLTPLLQMWRYINWLRNGFWTRTADASVITPMALTHPSIPLETGRAISAEIWGLDDVFAPDDLGSGPYTQSIILYITCIIGALLEP